MQKKKKNKHSEAVVILSLDFTLLLFITLFHQKVWCTCPTQCKKKMTAKTRKSVSFASSLQPNCLLPASLFSFLNVIPPCTHLFTYICTHHRLDGNVNGNAIITFFLSEIGLPLLLLCIVFHGNFVISLFLRAEQ